MKRLVKWLCGKYRRAIRENGKMIELLADAQNKNDELHRRLLKAWSDECVRDCDLEDMHHALGSAGKAVEELQDVVTRQKSTIKRLRTEISSLNSDAETDAAALVEMASCLRDRNESARVMETTLRALSDSRNELVEELKELRGVLDAQRPISYDDAPSLAAQAMQTVAPDVVPSVFSLKWWFGTHDMQDVPGMYNVMHFGIPLSKDEAIDKFAAKFGRPPSGSTLPADDEGNPILGDAEVKP